MPRTQRLSRLLSELGAVGVKGSVVVGYLSRRSVAVQQTPNGTSQR